MFTIQGTLKSAIAGSLIGLACVGCAGQKPLQPWSPLRGSRAMPLPEGKAQVRAATIAVEESPLNGGGVASVEYGVTNKLTLGAAIGQDASLSGISQASGIDASFFSGGAQVGEATGIYQLSDDGEGGGLAVQLDLNLLGVDRLLGEEVGRLEIAPAVNFARSLSPTSGFQARGGGLFADGFSPGFFAEGAYWTQLGEMTGVIEIDAQIRENSEEVYATPSVNFQLRELVQLQIGVPIGLSGDASDWQMITGLILRF